MLKPVITASLIMASTISIEPSALDALTSHATQHIVAATEYVGTTARSSAFVHARQVSDTISTPDETASLIGLVCFITALLGGAFYFNRDN